MLNQGISNDRQSTCRSRRANTKTLIHFHCQQLDSPNTYMSFGQWEEPGDNPQLSKENMQTK